MRGWRQKFLHLPAIERGNLPAYGLIALAAACIFWRDPRYFLQPRFWAEEGSLHFACSFSRPVLQALFQPQLGYLNFWTNLATVLATYVPLEKAPLVTTLLAFLVQLLVVGFIVFSRSALWGGWGRKAIGAAGVLFVPMTTETWLNSVNSYYYWALVAFLLLLEEAPESWVRRWAYRGLLVCAGLTGVHACFLIPLFFYRAWDEKKAERWLQMAILLICAGVHIGLILAYQGKDDISQRFTIMGFSTLGSILWTQSLAPFGLGYQRASEWSVVLFRLQASNPGLFQLIGRSLLVAAGMLFCLAAINLTARLRVLFVGGYSLLLFLPLLFSTIQDNSALIMTGIAGRLFVAPNILLCWMLLAAARFPVGMVRFAWLHRLAGVLVGALLCLGLIWGFKDYWQPWVPESAWVSWSQEVQTWQADHSYRLRIQPEGWTVQLAEP